MSIWFTEELHPYYRKSLRVRRVLADEQTRSEERRVGKECRSRWSVDP